MNIGNVFHRLVTWMPRAVHRKGFGVQSPWAYELVRDVFFERMPYYAFERLRRQAGRVDGSGMWRRHNERLFRIANYMRPSSIVDVNDGCLAGILYLSSPHSHIPCTLVSNSEKTSFLEEMFRGNVCSGNHLSVLQSLFSDGGHIGLLRIGDTDDAGSIYDWAAAHADNHSVVILENLPENAGLWKRIVADERAVITFDFYRWGMIVFDRKRVKQNYLL
ncbi:MAG: hypothetical protein NC206_01140 [Bacteroides sp.]|nr:hypothetical protein [Roseburia sp.]MCM1345676.1 hypothetical protein [Bacteroides sp.]MCM1420441.1 hypothetical protein [Bacteroides sp.]